MAARGAGRYSVGAKSIGAEAAPSMTRMIAIFIGVFFVGLAALMASVTIFVRDPMPVLSARAPIVIQEGDTPEADGLRATLSVDPTYAFEVMGQGARDGDVPGITMQRGEGDGSTVDVEVEEIGEGIFQGRGQFTAPGRWTLTVSSGDQRQEVAFILQE